MSRVFKVKNEEHTSGEKFIGFHLGESTNSTLSLMCALRGQSRSSLIRVILDNWHLNITKEGTLKQSTAEKAYHIWHIEKEHTSAGEFSDLLKKDLISKGVTEKGAKTVCRLFLKMTENEKEK